ASAALPLLDNALRHCRRRGALHLPARRSERDPCHYSDRLLADFHFIFIRIGQGKLPSRDKTLDHRHVYRRCVLFGNPD
ncbi:MAG TPA: hypothetical protein VI485_21725, partial [Vicinamibacterales bacterium]|nr:hypothetical protein [Vicinamibacterales bacterium]